MDVLLDDAAKAPAPGAAEALLLDGAGARLLVRVGEDEELVEAALWISEDGGAGEPSFASAPEFSTDLGTDLAGIQWISADWGSSRTLESITPAFASAAGLGVRVRVARGASQWYTPPGPTGAAVPDSGGAISLPISFPDAVADRVMLEFVETGVDAALTSTFKSATLGANPALNFGREAKDFELGVEGKRPFFNHAGQPGASVEVPKLLDTLREQLELEALSGTEISLALSAGVAGYVGLKWAFVRDRITRSFSDERNTSTLALDWNDAAQVTLFEREQASDPRAQARSLELRVEVDPVQERLVLDPEPASLGERLGELVKPLLDAGQRLTLDVDDPLVGVSLWCRPLSQTLSGAIDLVADVDGKPGGETLASAAISIDDPSFARRAPRWLSFDFSADTPIEGPVWLRVHLEQGELNWLLGGPRDDARVGAPHYRPNDSGTGGAWLSREALSPQSWALTRVRARSLDTPPPPVIELLLVAGDGSITPVALSPDTEGKISWTPPDPSAIPGAVSIHVRVSSQVAAAVTLLEPRLSWRELSASEGVEGVDDVDVIEVNPGDQFMPL